jgi:hypothetical protein
VHGVEWVPVSGKITEMKGWRPEYSEGTGWKKLPLRANRGKHINVSEYDDSFFLPSGLEFCNLS